MTGRGEGCENAKPGQCDLSASIPRTLEIALAEKTAGITTVRHGVHTHYLTPATVIATCIAVCVGQIGLAIPAVLNGLFQTDLGTSSAQLTLVTRPPIIGEMKPPDDSAAAQMAMPRARA